MSARNNRFAMPRTTVNIDGPVFRDLKRLQETDGRSLGRLISDLLAQALGQLRTTKSKAPRFSWRSRSMRAKVDLSDKEAVRRILDGDRKA